MLINVRHQVPVAESYRAAKVRGLFNATDEQATRFELDADLPIDDDRWRIGVVVGPSGSGKSSIGRTLWDGSAFYPGDDWPADAPIIDAIDPGGDFEAATAALSAAGLGDVPVWLRPYRVLSTGQRFRADLARVIAEQPDRVVIDEFTSTVDRQIARVGAGAFARAWRRGSGQAVLLTCHHDVLDWLEPDWVYDTGTATFTRGSVQFRRPRIDVEVRLGGWNLWPAFRAHHYLDLPKMVAARAYVGFVDGEPVAHVGITTKSLTTGPHADRIVSVEARASRLVVMPEWQGAGVGTRFLNHVAELQRTGNGTLQGRRMTTLFHTSHPNLAAALRRDDRWRQITARLTGHKTGRSERDWPQRDKSLPRTGYGGHFRALQGFRYYG
ncbi:GNAT family N-acetyltransferase [Actinokineospora cianjurensis]|uniref:Acetyltransferase (GNAT) family protein n=1 Tax=Actinokineospora cianjurensis TaxID=585224 RepID=A0A421AY96_9PSEU|nr:GNAT family N-acetyltransferase [Actinokineospora cianjurensis]RLK54837.1 acetyltransferase (GNAT) family protein [Actinokineospora cianjurensis]